MKPLVKQIESEQAKPAPEFRVGDMVDVHVRIKEGDKERTQVFRGTVIARRGAGLSETFTVRRLVQGEGVERIYPLHSPNIINLEVKKGGSVRRAKLYYLRGKVGKATRIRDRYVSKPAEGTPEDNGEGTAGTGEDR